MCVCVAVCVWRCVCECVFCGKGVFPCFTCVYVSTGTQDFGFAAAYNGLAKNAKVVCTCIYEHLCMYACMFVMFCPGVTGRDGSPTAKAEAAATHMITHMGSYCQRTGRHQSHRVPAQPPPQLTLAAYMYICICVCIYVCIYACMHICVCVCMYVYAFMYTHTHA